MPKIKHADLCLTDPAAFLCRERVQVLRDNGGREGDDGTGVPSLVYISREKSPRHHHHFKAGAMNVLVHHLPTRTLTWRAAALTTDE